LHPEIVFDDVADQRWPLAGCRVDDRDPVDDLSDFRRSERTRDGGVEREKKKSNDTDG
jgi:hypothetical protein